MIKNAIAYITRKKNRTFIIFVILTIVLSCLYSCLNIMKSTISLENNLYKLSNTSLSITQNNNENFKTNQFKEIENITSYLKSKKIDNVKFTFGLTTNATLLKEEIVKYFVDNDFVIAISIDGDEQSNSYRIYKNETKTYNDIYRNIEFVKNNYPEYFKKNVHFISVLHDKNCDFDIRNH